MTAHTVIYALTMLIPSALLAQPSDSELLDDPIKQAIQAFNNRDRDKPNEVIVDISPHDSTEQTVPSEITNPKGNNENPASAILVTGKPPADATLVNLPATRPEPEIITEPTAPPKDGLEVRVKSIQSGQGPLDPSTIKLLAPFPAKPLNEAPAGWRLVTSDDAPLVNRDVEISSGNKVTLTIRPHILIPDANGADHFSIPEPGFNASLGYNQNATVAAVLSQSIQQLDDDAKNLSAVIDQLQQLLVSLPKPEPAPPQLPTPPAKQNR